MSWRSQEATVQILNAIGNPIRKAAIEALNKGGMRFSQLLASCDLDYDHDAGHFHYHLSELIDRRIVEKTKDDYRLTEFGQRVAELLSSLDKECSFLFLKKPEGGERKVDTHKLKTEWLEPGKEIVFKKKTDKDFMFATFYPESDSMQKLMATELPDGPERRKLIKALEESKSRRKPEILVVKDGDTPLGWVTVMHKISWGYSADTFDKESGKYDITSKSLITIESLDIASWTEHRNDVASILLKELTPAT